MFRNKIVFYNKKLMYMCSKLRDLYDLMSSLIGLGLESLEYDFALIIKVSRCSNCYYTM